MTSNPTITPKPTTSIYPTLGPQCEGSNPKVCGCASVNQADYRGTISTTASGRECSRWDETEFYNSEYFLDAGLEDNNYCRNPTRGWERAFCITISENGYNEQMDCDVPICEDSLPSAYPSTSLHPTISSLPTVSIPPTQGPQCKGSNPKVCGCTSVNQADYRGTINTTISGKECQVWDDYYAENHPNADLDNNNYCRNPEPERKERAWCNTGEYEWEDCNVPICEDSLPSAYPSSSPHPTTTTRSPTLSPKPTTSQSPTIEPQCEGSNPEVCGCGSVGQADYRGTTNATASGKNCIRWDEHSYYNFIEDHPDAGLEDNNYCRNPTDYNGYNRAYCWTSPNIASHVDTGSGLFGYEGEEFCDIPFCFPPASSCLSVLDVNANISSMSEELHAACAYHQCVAGSKYKLDDYIAPKRAEVEPNCLCAFEIWDCQFGTKDCESRLDSDYGAILKCCTSKVLDGSTTSQASCECSIKPGCEAGDSSKCLEVAEYCCDKNDQQCKCEYQTKACRLALESDSTKEVQLSTVPEYCGGSWLGGGAVEACCGEDNDDIGLCTCDFWEPLCTDFPNAGVDVEIFDNIISTTCNVASTSCCRGAHCSCDFYTHAVEALGYEGDAESTCAAASNIAPDNEVELQSLQSIYNEMSGDYWLNNTGWKTEQDQCSWFGITCDEQGYVIEINLPSNNITGEFPANSLSSFYNLQRLNLRNNLLHGIMAGSYSRAIGIVSSTSLFFNLRDLTHVDLSQNNLSGEVDVLFAPALQYANFSHNNFTSINSFKKFKRSYQTLTICDMSHNSINTSASDLMTNVPTNIEQFILSSNLIHGSLPTTLEVLPNLRRFNMSMNSLSGELPDFSSVYASLQVLDLSDQGLIGNIPESLANLPFLSTLILGSNLLAGSIPPVIGNMGQLRVLYLSSNKLSQTIPKELGKLGELAHIICIFCRVMMSILLTCLSVIYPSRS